MSAETTRPNSRPDRRPHRGTRLAFAVLAGAGALALGACGDSGGEATADRQAEVAERGSSVMPFDLEATTHRFEPRADGLLQTVVSDDPGDAEQVNLVREHLADEVERFTAGDFSDPSAIHGDEMPGLAELTAGAGDIDIEYSDVTDGASITFTTDAPGLVDALHRWSEAQVSDHGDHAEGVGDSDHDGAG